MRKNIILPLFFIVTLCLLVSCQKTQPQDGEISDATLDFQTNDTVPCDEYVESDTITKDEFDYLLEMTYNEMETAGITMCLSYYEGGAAPVYEIAEHEGVYLVFASEEGIHDAYPMALYIRDVGIEAFPGIEVGMTAEEVEEFSIEWEDVCMSSENSLYYTSFRIDTKMITAAWAIPEVMFSTWVASLNDEDDYYAKFTEFIQPFQNKPVGTIVELTVKILE